MADSRGVVSLLVPVVVVSLLSIGCATGPSRAAASDGGTAARAHMVGIDANMVTGRTLAEVLPNRRTELGGHDISVTDAIVMGHISDAELGLGHRPPQDGSSAAGQQVAGVSDRAAWRSAYLTVEVQEVIGHQVLDLVGGDTIRVGVTLDGGPIDTEEVLSSLRSLDTALFFVKRLPFGVDGTDDVLHLAFAGASTMVADDGGRLALPLYTRQAAALVAERAEQIPTTGPVPTDLTLGSLREMASAPVEHVQLAGA